MAVSQPDASAPSLQQLRAARGRSASFWHRRRVALATAGLVTVALLFGFFGLPPIVRAEAVKRLSAALGRVVTIERVRINPLVFSVSIEGLALAEAGPSPAPFLGWRLLHADLDAWSLLTGRVSFDAIILDGLHAQVLKSADGKMNFDDLLAGNAGEKPAPADGQASTLPVVKIRRLEVTAARVAFRDASRVRPYSTEVGPISFLLEDFQTLGGVGSPYRFEAVTAAGERLAWKGTLSADPFKSQGNLLLENIDLARFSPYYHDLRKGELRSAFIDLDAEYSLELSNGAPALRLANALLTLREVRLGEPGAAKDALAIRRVAVSGISADSTTLQARIDKIGIEGVRIMTTREASGLDLARLFEPIRPAGQRPLDDAAKAVAITFPELKLGEFSISDVQAQVLDLTTPRRAEHRFEAATLILRGLDTEHLEAALPLEIEAKLPGSGRIAAAGTVTVQPLAVDLELTLERIALNGLSPYLEPLANLRLADGAVRARGRAGLREGSVAFVGDFGVAGFRVVEGKSGADLVKWTDLAMTGVRVASAPLAFHAEEIRLLEPGATLRIEADGSLGFLQPAGTGTVLPSAETEPKPAAPVAIEVGRISFEQGAFRFEDRSIRPAARAGITDFGGHIAGLTSEAWGRAELALQGKVDGLAPVSIRGKFNPLGRPAFVDLALDMKGIDLQPGGGPYVGKFAGRTLTSGKLGVAVKARVEDRKVDLNNVVTLDRFYLGEPTNSPDATTLPVGLALALLRDSSGKIVIDLPVRGSLDDPDFRIGRVVLRVLGNILMKAASSPFSLLGAAFGGGGEELGHLDFAAGSATPDEPTRAKLQVIAKALAGRPSLRLDIAGSYDLVADGQFQRMARLEREVRTAAWEMRRQVDVNTPPAEELEITPELRAGMLAKLYAAAFPAAGAGSPPVVVIDGPSPVTAAEKPRAASVTRPGGGDLRRSLGPRGRLTVQSERGRRLAAAVAGPAKSALAPAPQDAVPLVLAAAETISPAEMEARLLERIAIPEAELEAIGAGRAEVVRSALLEGGNVAADRITLLPVKASGVRLNLQLN